ncbi:MAG: 3-phosphoshikimate 1-carboxyvinyltransferase, partial [Endomicrobia bacterium]|nr:3-phosphoshikimate 1-carboxyvinyltransferase [Endomicrobiia bacterium]
MKTVKVYKKNKINAEINVAADKSITHRCIMLASISEGECVIKNFLKSRDCYATINALRMLGVKIIEQDNILKVYGSGLQGFKQPQKEIDAGNSGTTVRLLSGMLAGNPIEVKIVGDESLSRRPMKRIIEPLTLMGAKITAVENNYLPMTIKGNQRLHPITWENTVASAQVKSCILFAGMYAEGETIYKEPVLSRD